MVSVYFGEDIATGSPYLSPPASRSCEELGIDKGMTPHGARLVNAGDVVVLELGIASMLPEPLTVTNMVLALAPVDGHGVAHGPGE